jgi:large subunit ribosomal protein L10
MAITREQKANFVNEINAVAQSALSAVTADYCGLSVTQMNKLRSQARERNVYLRIARNTLFKRAVEGTEFDCLTDNLSGPILLALSKEEPGAAARLFRDFKKENDQLEVKSLAIGGESLPASDLDKIAKLPTYDEAIATLMSVMNAPITQLVRTINEPCSQMVRAVAAIRDQKQEAS